MGTNAELVLSQVAIPTERLETRRPAQLSQFSVKRPTRAPVVSHEFGSMLVAATVDMIDGEESPVSLSTAHALAAVGFHRFLSSSRAATNLCVVLCCRALWAGALPVAVRKFTAACAAASFSNFAPTPIPADFRTSLHDSIVPRGWANGNALSR